MSDAKCKCKWYNMYICTQFVLHSQGKCYDWMWYDCACCAKPAGMLKFSIHPVHFFIARTSLRGQLAIFLHLQSDEKLPATVEDSSNTGIFGGCLYRNWCRILVKQQFFTGGKRGFDPNTSCPSLPQQGKGTKTTSTHQAAVVVEVASCIEPGIHWYSNKTVPIPNNWLPGSYTTTYIQTFNSATTKSINH